MASAFGAFGKMPALGDFFRFNLAADFVSAWDGWLQTGFPAAREEMAQRWSEAYMSAPIWRFTLAPGLAGPAGMLGVFMPSVDRVGRQFPLTLAVRLDGGSPALASHFAAGRTFEHLETVALAALEDDATRDGLAERLESVAVTQRATTSRLGSGPGLLTLRAGGLSDLAPELAAGLAGQRLFRPSVWSADVVTGARLMVCEGLPDPAGMRGMFDLDAPIWASGLAG